MDHVPQRVPPGRGDGRVTRATGFIRSGKILRIERRSGDTDEQGSDWVCGGVG